MTQAPIPPTGGEMGGVRPHRGTMILVFGILGLVVCVIFGIFAWVWGKADLEAMAAGEMDRSGEGMTMAGKICGMISCILTAVGLCIFLGYLVLAATVLAGAAAGGGAGP